jgi:RNA polymerase sigma-70 factor (ECF subfamily)
MPPPAGAIAPVLDVGTTAAVEQDEGLQRSEPVTGSVARERMLVSRLRRRDERAFAELVRAYQDRVFNLTFRMLGNRQEAEDLAQEIFVSLHGALDGFRGDSRLSTWIFRVTRNHCLNRLKYLTRRERGRSSELSQVPESSFSPSDDDVSPDEAIEAKERRLLVRKAMEALDEEHRVLVVLRDIEGLSYDEIAAITDQPEGTVKSRLHRARIALAEALAGVEGVRR